MSATLYVLLMGTETHTDVLRRSISQTYRVTQANKTCINTVRDNAETADVYSLLETATQT